MNRIKLPRAILALENQIPIPMTASGGTNDAAIATPARPAAIFFQPNARNATNHDANAIPRSTRVGCILIAISLVISVRGRKSVNKKLITIPHTILMMSIHSDFTNKRLLPVVVAKATP